MGHYVTTYCSAHGEVDMDDSLAFCPDCYEVTPKGALTEARAEIERRKDYAEQCRAQSATIVRLGVELEACERPLRARIAELEADVVWAVKNARIIENPFDGGYCVEFTDGDSLADVDCDGTPADILRAVREARNGE